MKSPAFLWYPKDILASSRVAEMSLAEEGAYRRLLDYCWLHGSIPTDEKRVARIIGKGATMEIAKICMPMFVPHPTDRTRLIHDRLERERQKQQENSDKRKKAAEARWNKRGTPAEGSRERVKSEVVADDANACDLHMQNDALQFASTTPEEEKEETKNVSSKKKKGCRIPENYRPPERLIEWALKTVPGINIENRIKEFKNYWEAKTGKDATKLNWDKTFENRILQIAEYQGNKNGSSVFSKQQHPSRNGSDSGTVRDRLRAAKP